MGTSKGKESFESFSTDAHQSSYGLLYEIYNNFSIDRSFVSIHFSINKSELRDESQFRIENEVSRINND